jgi:hypothetical protein
MSQPPEEQRRPARDDEEVCGSRWPELPNLARCMRPAGHPPDVHDAMPGKPGWAWSVASSPWDEKSPGHILFRAEWEFIERDSKVYSGSRSKWPKDRVWSLTCSSKEHFDENREFYLPLPLSC